MGALCANIKIKAIDSGNYTFKPLGKYTKNLGNIGSRY